MSKIKTFKEFINESVWGDIYKRGAGEQARKEDDIERLSDDDFVEYLKSKYKNKEDGRPGYFFRDITERKEINVCPFGDKRYHYTVALKKCENQNDKIILYPIFTCKKCKDLYDKLKKEFIIKKISGEELYGKSLYTGYYLEVKDNYNKPRALYIQIIDFILNNLDTTTFIPLIEKI